VTWRQKLPIALTALSYARDFIGIEEIGSNRGPAVEWFQQRGEIGPGDAWCAAFANGILEITCAVHNVRSPLENVQWQGYVQSYYDYAIEQDWVVDWELTYPGCLFVKWFGPPKSRFAHIGFMDTLLLEQRKFQTVEGNSNDDGSAEGYKVAQNWRVDGDEYRYLDWTKGVIHAA